MTPAAPTRYPSRDKPFSTNSTPNVEPGGDTTTPLTQPRIMMLLPAELLQGDETIVLLLKPSPWYIFVESLWSLVVLGIILAVPWWVYNQGYNIEITPRDLLLLGIGLGGMRLGWQFLEWLSRVYVLTDRRVIRVKGVLRVQVFETPLRQIQHTNTTFSLRERLLGLGSIHFATAGTGSTEASWVMLSKPLEIHRIVVQTLNQYR